MRANEIKDALHNQNLLRYREDGSSKIVDELKICGGQSIADMAIVNGSLHAFEIKSMYDNLDRLSGQLKNYFKVFDYTTVVVAGNHYTKILKYIPEDCGIWTIEESKITETRKAKRNLNVDAFSIAQLLWKEEAIQLLISKGVNSQVKKKRKWVLWQLLAENFPVDELAKEVRFIIKQRPDWKRSCFAN